MKWVTISLTPPHDFDPLHRHLNISRATIGGSSPLRVASSWTRTRNLFVSGPKLLTTKLCVVKGERIQRIRKFYKQKFLKAFTNYETVFGNTSERNIFQ